MPLRVPGARIFQRKECMNLSTHALIEVLLDGEPSPNLSHKELAKFVIQPRCIRFR